eukprot:UN13875
MVAMHYKILKTFSRTAISPKFQWHCLGFGEATSVFT